MSEAQNIANISNAQHSTGPRTEEGKASSSRNSLSHGLTAKTVLLPGEDPAEYQTFAEGVRKDFESHNATQSALIQELIDIQWRLLRVPAIEARILSEESPDLKALANIGLYAGRLKRQYSATLKEILRLKELFDAQRNDRLERAGLIHHADFIKQRPDSYRKFGFDFSVEEIEAYIHEKEAVRAARRTLNDKRVNWAL